MTETHEITVDRRQLHESLIAYHRALDSSAAHIHLRVGIDGVAYISAAAGYECSPDEYYARMPHVVTVFHASACGQCSLAEDWTDDDGDLLPQVDEIIAKLEDAGYSVREE